MKPSDASRSTEAIYTTQQVAERLGISVSTVQQLVESGVISGWKTQGGHRRIPESALEHFLSRHHTSVGTRSFVESDPATRSSLLVLEDDLVQQTLYRGRISNWQLPLDLTFCTNGYDALIEVAMKQPDILLLDIMMDGIDGYEVLKALTSRPNFRLSHIAVLTNLSETEVDARGGLPAGVLYMSKPINFDELRGYLRGCCAAKTRLYAK
ncbi:MAG: excisionase family DNA-binding protein [Alcaligenaceae bacterium]|nr:excisionase family DNA-binding protein [Alcaligenaceae bacterium]